MAIAVSFPAAAESSHSEASACSRSQVAGTRGVAGPSAVSRMMPALCSPCAISTTLRASRIVATPIVMAWVGTFSSAEEIAGRVAPRDRVERRQPRAAHARRKRLVEADVPVAADAQQLDVDAAGLRDRLLRTAGNGRSPGRPARVPSGMWMFSRGMLTWSKKCSNIQRW